MRRRAAMPTSPSAAPPAPSSAKSTAATAPPKPSVITNPSWSRQVAPEFPERAQSRGIESGSAKVNCAVAPNGSLSDCRIVDEDPAGAGFGQAGLNFGLLGFQALQHLGHDFGLDFGAAVLAAHLLARTGWAGKALAGEVFPPRGRNGTKAHAMQMPSARLSHKAPLACPPARAALRGRR